MELVPVRSRDAAAFVAEHHRHNGPPAGQLFAIGVSDGPLLVGVLIAGRPVARHYDDGRTVEVTRCATNGAHNAASMLYGAAWRVARGLGYRRLITYTQGDEPGTSLTAAGWRVLAVRPPRPGWNRPARPRQPGPYVTNVTRTLWEAG